MGAMVVYVVSYEANELMVDSPHIIDSVWFSEHAANVRYDDLVDNEDVCALVVTPVVVNSTIPL
jgi:hypothetical protein